MSRRLMFVLALVLVGAAVGAGLLWHTGLLSGDTDQHAATSDQQLPDFSLMDTSGQHWNSAGREGQIVVINFWALWCRHCVDEIATLNAMQREFHDRGLRIVGISPDSPEAIADFRTQHAIEYPLLVANDSAVHLSRQLGNAVQGVPYTVIFDRQGQRVFSQLGKIDGNDLRQRLMQLLE